MNIPDTIKVGALTYNIIIVDGFDDDKDGEHNPLQLKITIRKGKQEAMENTFWHEVVHAFNSETKSEEYVQALANSFQLFIKDNPGVFK